MTIYDEMLSSILAERLQNEIKAYESELGIQGFLIAASHALSDKDTKKLVAAAKKEHRRLLKKANGCPPRVWGWRDHYS